MFDTGSSWTWVYSLEGCDQAGHKCPSVEKYSAVLSDTESTDSSSFDDVSLLYALG